LIFQWSDETNTFQIRIVPWTNYFFGATSRPAGYVTIGVSSRGFACFSGSKLTIAAMTLGLAMLLTINTNETGPLSSFDGVKQQHTLFLGPRSLGHWGFLNNKLRTIWEFGSRQIRPNEPQRGTIHSSHH
jgi:hypothetical protein